MELDRIGWNTDDKLAYMLSVNAAWALTATSIISLTFSPASFFILGFIGLTLFYLIYKYVKFRVKQTIAQLDFILKRLTPEQYATMTIIKYNEIRIKENKPPVIFFIRKFFYFPYLDGGQDDFSYDLDRMLIVSLKQIYEI